MSESVGGVTFARHVWCSDAASDSLWPSEPGEVCQTLRCTVVHCVSVHVVFNHVFSKRWRFILGGMERMKNCDDKGALNRTTVSSVVHVFGRYSMEVAAFPVPGTRTRVWSLDDGWVKVGDVGGCGGVCRWP